VFQMPWIWALLSGLSQPRTPTISEVKELQAIEQETSDGVKK